MPVKTVTIQVTALTDKANQQIRTTSDYFDKLRAKNPVELKVKLDTAEALAQAAILRRELSGIVSGKVSLDGGGSIWAKALGVSGKAQAAGWAGIGAGVGAAGLAVGAGGIIPALAAAGAGLAAFGALAIPTFSAVTGAISGVSAANAKFAEAAQNVDIAISTSHADLLLYNKALAAMPPNLASAAKLLGNQSVTWQALTKSQQNNVIALSQNKGALSSLLPAQRTALTQLLNSKAVWDQLSPAQQKVAVGWQNMSSAFSNMATQLSPVVLKIMASGLQAINAFLPAVLQLAVPAGNALAGLATRIAGFLQLTTTISVPGSDKIKTVLTPFGEFVQTLAKLSGPAITAIGTGIGQIAVALGKLLLALENPAGVKILSGLLSGVALAITAIGSAIRLVGKLPPGVVRPLAELAGALLILSKLGVVSVGLRLLGFGGAGAAAGGAAASAGLWARLLPGVRLIAGALVATVVVAMVLKSVSSGPGGKNWWDNPGGADPTSRDPNKQGVSTWVGLGHQIEKIWGATWLSVRNTAQHAFDQIVIQALLMADGIARALGHLPSFLGAPFRAAHQAIAAELDRIQGKASTTVSNIRNYWLGLNGLVTTLVLNVASSVPVITGGTGQAHVRVPGQAAGTMSAAPGWAWVGERGPELAYFHGGETVIPSHIARGYASGTGRSPQIDELIAAVYENTDVLAGLLAAAPARTGAGIGAALAMGGRSAVYGALYP